MLNLLDSLKDGLLILKDLDGFRWADKGWQTNLLKNFAFESNDYTNVKRDYILKNLK